MDDCFQPAPLADPLGEVLHMLRLTGTLYCRATMTAPWGLIMPRLVDSMIFVIVTAGRCIAEIDGESVPLSAGTMVLIPHGDSFRLLSDADARAVPLFDLPVEKISERYELMTYGGGGELTRAMAGVVQFDSVAGQRMMSTLPRIIRIDGWDESLGDWVGSTLGLIAREASALKPGGEIVMTRLADILVIQAIRAWLDSAPESEQGWLAALRDPQLGRALVAIHRYPQTDWTLTQLARQAGMSRSAFSARFSARLGQSAMAYLAQWRLHLARARLMESTDPLASVAREAGYRSEAAFSRAFRQHFGKPPGAMRRSVAA
ncbi:AraC family transcriptional regulator [Pelagibacterium flavum]|uniref:AraC family transcriptional regulator n=1 Tax=Pelagibacterium flavum TaxID=2984530 RepID=A0ABY6ITQ3_9HYPH|nr:AraC family transcriptional regulator [Pelagibacterium sp. YIM 151497]UYQ74013.1 AraC family transcriptional regulator [Pelagibacterium sp. YIM 151497]|tara:strand:- start:1140 stop:2093 length:954 start_codon:yes stop_codon:yes gene_type:complete